MPQRIRDQKPRKFLKIPVEDRQNHPNVTPLIVCFVAIIISLITPKYLTIYFLHTVFEIVWIFNKCEYILRLYVVLYRYYSETIIFIYKMLPVTHI